tara:strand:- start:1125 stop:1352 length:228 start_codon:yes stop_codon:yes gene_type:complete
MQKNYLHNGKSVNTNKDKKKPYQFLSEQKKSVVDINILLNRVKIEEKNKIKKKIIFFSLITSGLSLFGALIVIIK